MSNKWQIVVLGLAVVQGAGLGAMENKTPNSPRRNPLSCSREEAVIAEVLKKKLSVEKIEKPTPKYDVYYPWPGANPEYYYTSGVKINDRMKPWYPGH
jgi:hypothetical protein